MVMDIPTKSGQVPDLKQRDVRETANIGPSPNISNFTDAQHDHTNAAGGGNLGAGAKTGDHGTASIDQIVNVSYGTGSPPTASTTTEGSIFFKYTA